MKFHKRKLITMKARFLGQCSTVVIVAVSLYLIAISGTNKHLLFFSASGRGFFAYPPLEPPPIPEPETLASPTNLSHLYFGLIGSVKAWPHRRACIESWWRPNATRGVLFLDKHPTPALLPWSEASPEFRVSDDISGIVKKRDTRAQRMVHGIMEAVREAGEGGFRWLVMGDDDSIFFVENMVDVVAELDHTRHYYLGGQSEFIMSSYWYSFNQAFGGAGIMLSYATATAMARGMEGCLKRYAFLKSADNTTKNCIADIGVNLYQQLGNHQIDLRGDISGFLSAHPPSPLLSLHHFDAVDPIFPSRGRIDSTRHLMTAAEADQSRMLQQTICYHRQLNWSVSIAWGYSAQIYEKIMPRSHLQKPMETFRPWHRNLRPPYYRFNTRPRTQDPCEAPHVFFLDVVEKEAAGRGEIKTMYARARPRDLEPCADDGGSSADGINTISVYSPAAKRNQMNRCECCDIVGMDNTMTEIRLRECMPDEIIA